MDEKLKWIFGAAGNIIKTHTDEAGIVYYGSKAFKGGTKVYLDGKYWEQDWNEISVIGQNRFGRWVYERVPTELIENVREQRIYNPKVLDIISHIRWLDGVDWWEQTVSDKKDVKRFVKKWNDIIQS